MKRIENDDIKPMVNNILISFKQFCDKHDIYFFLAYGTLIGAIRHQGFIPWDDDIDLLMKKDQIDKLKKIVKLNKTNYIDEEKRYAILFPLDEGNIYPFIKIIDTKTIVYEKNISHKYALGLWIDIFELENCPDSIKECKKLSKKQRFYNKMNEIMIAGNIKDTKFKVLFVLSRPIKLLFSILGFSTSFWVKKMMNLAPKEKTKNLGCVCFGSCVRDRNPVEIFDKKINVQFEGNSYYAPSNYDYCLRKFYGNYMKIPPKEKQIKHDFEAYLL